MGAPSRGKLRGTRFKPLFVDAGRIVNGVKFWNDNAELLARARNEFGVPEQIIVSLIGIETRYGKQVGGIRVLDSLATLAFDWPARAGFFRGELEQFLLLAREQRWDPAQVRGSFAGAMGLRGAAPCRAAAFATLSTMTATVTSICGRTPQTSSAA